MCNISIHDTGILLKTFEIKWLFVVMQYITIAVAFRKGEQFYVVSIKKVLQTNITLLNNQQLKNNQLTQKSRVCQNVYNITVIVSVMLAQNRSKKR